MVGFDSQSKLLSSDVAVDGLFSSNLVSASYVETQVSGQFSLSIILSLSFSFILGQFPNWVLRFWDIINQNEP